MTREEYIDFANALKNNYTIDFDKLPEFCDMAISALSENKGDFDGMANGEVLQAIISGLEPIVLSNETGAIYFDWEWWDAPYQKGGE